MFPRTNLRIHRLGLRRGLKSHDKKNYGSGYGSGSGSGKFNNTCLNCDQYHHKRPWYSYWGFRRRALSDTNIKRFRLSNIQDGKTTPYGGTLIHGFHMIALCSYFFESAGLRPVDGAYSLNYGLDNVRVLKPVVIGDGVRLRSHVSLLKAQDKGNGETLLTTTHQVEVEGKRDYALYAEYLSYWYPDRS